MAIGGHGQPEIRAKHAMPPAISNAHAKNTQNTSAASKIARRATFLAASLNSMPIKATREEIKAKSA